ncbi:MAG: DUF4340 domain-containing protein [Phycisphaerales bacterium]|jgi:hypothetical protein
MSNKKLTVLGVVAVIMVMWAVVQSQVSNRSKVGLEGPAPLIQGLNTADIDGISIGKGEESVMLRRKQGRFVVAGKDDYPAKVSQINDLISKCLKIQTSEFVTDNPANFEDLGVTEEKASSVVKFFRPDSNLLTGVIGGNAKELGEGNYVRRAGDDKVYVTPSLPWLSSSSMGFIEQELITMKAEEVESVTVNTGDGEYMLKSTEGGGVVMENMPAGRKLKDGDARAVLTALTSLRCEDVRKKPDNLAFNKQYFCKLKDSTVYSIEIAHDMDKTYVSCEAFFTGEQPVKAGREAESDEEMKTKLLAYENAVKFANKHKGWAYQIADNKVKNLTKKLSDLLENEEKPQEANEADSIVESTPDNSAGTMTEEVEGPRPEDSN